ncbi:penicillin-binding protein 2 [Candidatus Bipolaricaulota bacterium]|nr:penicillin-binding protein 2 [Candidatus Bipolaricaulota bacterium]
MINRKRLFFVASVLFAVIGLVIWRLVSIQILQRESWDRRAEAIHEKKVKIPPERGRIYDRNGQLLAFNREAYQVAVDSYNMTKPELMIDILVNELRIQRRKLESLVYRESYFTWIDRSVSYETGKRIKRRVENADIDGLILIDSNKRVYPKGTLAGSIVGFTGVDGEGLAGVEYSMNDALDGKPKVQRIIYGANRFPFRRKTLVEGRSGYDVYLTLDLKIQYILKNELQQGVEKFKAEKAWGVVIDPASGAVLGMAQNKGYNPNVYDNYTGEERKNIPISNSFEPGSVLKVFSGLAALDHGIVEPDTMVNGNSPIYLYNHPINNAQYRDYGVVPFSEVIKHSINTGIIRVSQDLGERKLYNFLNKVGFGKKTGIELPGEQSGAFKHYSEWSGLSIGSIPIGQGLSVTALQLAAKMAGVANGGNMVKPTIISKVRTPGGETVSSLEKKDSIGGLFASPESVSEMKNMLRSVVKDGTGQDAAIPGYSVSGKTGTAQKAVPGGYSQDKYISSFVGFFPKENPHYLILIVLDEVGTRPVWGGATAGNIFREVGERIINSVNRDAPRSDEKQSD